MRESLLKYAGIILIRRIFSKSFFLFVLNRNILQPFRLLRCGESAIDEFLPEYRLFTETQLHIAGGKEAANDFGLTFHAKVSDSA